MRDIWVISDTHFLHKNILKFKDSEGNLIRGARFDTIEDHDATIMENWNSLVKPGDIVYHLGDVFMGRKDDFLPLWKKLHGTKRLVLGNHDDAKFFVKHELVTKVVMWRRFDDKGLLLTHTPAHESTLGEVRGKLTFNVHGHIHQNPSPSVRHLCVCVEQTDYKPVNIEELA